MRAWACVRDGRTGRQRSGDLKFIKSGDQPAHVFGHCHKGAPSVFRPPELIKVQSRSLTLVVLLQLCAQFLYRVSVLKHDCEYQTWNCTSYKQTNKLYTAEPVECTVATYRRPNKPSALLRRILPNANARQNRRKKVIAALAKKNRSRIDRTQT